MPTGKRVLGWMLVVLVFAVVPGIVVPTLMCRRETADLRDWGVVPAFQLVDERGQPFTEEALRGHSTIVSFLFTRCDTICPITTAKMRTMQDITADLGDRIKLLSFSVDPGYDTPERLDAYAQKFTADPERWRFVTGDPARERALVEGAFMTSEQIEGPRPSGVPNIAHGGYFMLVDSELHLRGSYDSNSPTELDQLQKDARYLARVGH